MRNPKKDVQQKKSIVRTLLKALLVLAALLIACLVGGSDVVNVILFLAIRSTIVVVYGVFVGDKCAFKKEVSNLTFDLALAIPYVVVSMIYPEINTLKKILVFILSVSAGIFCFSKATTYRNLLDLLWTVLQFVLSYLIGHNLFKKALVPAMAKISMKATENEKNKTNKYIVYLNENLKPALFCLSYGMICFIPLLDYSNSLSRNLESATSELEMITTKHLFNAGALGLFIFGICTLLGFVEFFIILLRMMKDDINETKNRIVTMQRIPNTKDESKVIMCNFKKGEEDKMDMLKLKQTLSRLGDIAIVALALTCVIANIWLKRACVVTYNYAVKVTLKAAEVCGEALCCAALCLVLFIRYTCVLETKLKAKIQAIKKVWNCKVKPAIKAFAEIAFAIGCIYLMFNLTLDKLNVTYVCYQIALVVILTIGSELKKIKNGKGYIDLDLVNLILIQISAIVCVNALIGYYPSLTNIHKLGKALITLIVIIVASVLAFRKDKQTSILKQLRNIDFKSLASFVCEQRKGLLLVFGIGFPMLCCLLEIEAIIASNLANFGGHSLFAFYFIAGLCLVVGVCGIILTIIIPLSFLIDGISRSRKI